MNDKEWRDLLWGEIKELRTEVKELRKENKIIIETMTTLKVKIGIVVSIFTGVTTVAWNYLKNRFS